MTGCDTSLTGCGESLVGSDLSVGVLGGGATPFDALLSGEETVLRNLRLELLLLFCLVLLLLCLRRVCRWHFAQRLYPLQEWHGPKAVLVAEKGQNLQRAAGQGGSSSLPFARQKLN